MACYYFKYTPLTGSSLYLEDEPIHWDKVHIILKRDRDWHGVNYEFTDSAIPLQFDCLSGSAFIEEIYQAQGGDGYVGFEFGYYDGVVEIPEYQGRIDLNSRKLLATYRISANVERAGLHEKIKTRWTTKANLFSSVSAGGSTIDAPVPVNLSLHSKVLINNYNKKTSVEGQATWTPCLGDEKHHVYFVFNTTPDSGVSSNIDATIGTSLGVACDDPITSGLYLFDLNSSGQFTFNIKLSYNINIGLMRKFISSRPKIGDWTLNNWLEVRDNVGALKYKKLIGTQSSGNVNGPTLANVAGLPVNKSLVNYIIELSFGDKVYLYADFELDGMGAGWKGVNAYIITTSTSIDVKAVTTTDATQAKMILVHEALQQAIAFATDENARLYSNFFGREDIGYALTGCGAHKGILNGFLIRQNNTNNPKLSPQDLMNSLNAIFCLGMGYETISGLNKIRVEERGYFYQDVEILQISNIGNYTEEVASDKVYNKILVGYLKYLYQDLQFLDEFNAEHEYASPIINNDNPLDIRSALVTSGYAIEITRRSQFADTPAESTQYDDDGFLIAVVPQDTAPITVLFSNLYGTGGYIQAPSFPQVIVVGDQLQITGSSLNDGTYQVVKVTPTQIFMNFEAATETATIVINNLSRPYLAEKDEAFSTVTGVLSPETSYNLRHTPKRNLMNWAKWINGGLYYKQAGDLVKNTLYKLNGELTTQFDSGESCPLGDTHKDLLQEKADVALAQFQDKDNFFIPEYVNFEARLAMSDIRLIRNAMTGQDNGGRNYGYITCLDQTGTYYVKSWIYNMTYNPNTESVKFMCLKKEMVPVIPPSPFVCSDYADYTFADFEALPDLSAEIEQCLFANFN